VLERDEPKNKAKSNINSIIREVKDPENENEKPDEERKNGENNSQKAFLSEAKHQQPAQSP